MLRSATVTIGILLSGLAFVGFLVLGGLLAPAPHSVVVAIQDIPAYSRLDPNVLGVDAQRINSQVARTLIRREEIDQYRGGFVLENIYAGEPLRKGAVVAPDNPQAVNRLALVMTDPAQVAMVIPVDAKTAPSQIAPGDWVDLVVGLAPGNISAGSGTTFSTLLTPTPMALSFPIGSSFPVTGTARATPPPQAVPPFSLGNTVTSTGSVSASDMNLPADKVVIQNVPVLAVRFQQVPNPAFTGAGGTLGQSSSAPTASQPAYVEGDIQSVTVLLPRSSVELVTFALDNGRVHLALLPPATAEASQDAQSPTFGITFSDVLAWMMRERSLALSAQPPTATGQGAAARSAPTQIAPTSVPTPARTVETIPPSPAADAQVPGPTRGVIGPSANPTAGAAAPIPTGLDVGALLIPLTCGIVLLVLFVAVVRFIRRQGRDQYAS